MMIETGVEANPPSLIYKNFGPAARCPFTTSNSAGKRACKAAPRAISAAVC